MECPSPFGHDLDRHAVPEEEAGVGVPEVVEPDGCHSQVSVGAGEGLGGEVRVERAAVGAGEHEVEFVGETTIFEASACCWRQVTRWSTVSGSSVTLRLLWCRRPDERV